MGGCTRNLLTVLFLGVTYVVQTISQVCPYSDKGCSCGSSITCYNLQQIPPLNTGVNVSKVTDLTFQGGNFNSIPSHSLPPGLTLIELFHLPLTNIADDAFDSSADTLTTVRLWGSELTSLPTALKTLSRLITLLIYDTPIQVWDNATLKQIATTVEILQLKNVGLSVWPSWISDFHSLRILDLSRNNVTTIPNDAFSSLTDTLTFLYLRGTGLTYLPQALSTLSSLFYLDLGDNDFTDVSQCEKITHSLFANKLSSLYLDSAGLTEVANFTKLTRLDYVNLSNNKITDVPVGSLPTLLTSLYLSDNSLSIVPKDVANSASLSILDISHNQITHIERNSLPSGLVYLFLDFNNLTLITNTTFRGLSLLDHLYLSYNPISEIEPAAFSDLVSLQYLTIEDAQMTEIPLAFTLLRPQVQLVMSTTQPLSCLCPVPRELVEWYSSLRIVSEIRLSCSNEELIDLYLRGQC